MKRRTVYLLTAAVCLLAVFALVLAAAMSGMIRGNLSEQETDDSDTVYAQQEEALNDSVGGDADEEDTAAEGAGQDVPENEPVNEPADEELVSVKKYIPDIIADLKYATTDNFTGAVIYDNGEALLRYGTVKKLRTAQERLKTSGYTLVLWDAYRPPEAQFKLWEICPDPTYVADPRKGFSSHSRGNTVDITAALSDGTLLEMPSSFDDFTLRADRDYSDVSQTAGENARMLEKIMSEAGFKGYSGEWWHYSDTQSYPVAE